MYKHWQPKRVAVIGAGVMGAQIAAHLANAGLRVRLFDLPGDDPKENLACKGLARLTKLSPAPLASSATAAWITPHDLSSDLAQLADCEVVIEAIAERPDWKADLYTQIEPYLAPNAYLASNTSGLSIASLAPALPKARQAQFCGVHFFNPPRYLPLVELIAHTGSDAMMLDRLEGWLTRTLGKHVLRAQDTPNFIANRIGVFAMMVTIHHAKAEGLRFDLVDDLTGARLSRPKSATFRTADLVGLDTLSHVLTGLRDQLNDDPWLPVFSDPAWLADLIKDGRLGNKTGGGIYRKVPGGFEVLQPDSGMYMPVGETASLPLQAILNNPDPVERLTDLRNFDHPEARFLWRATADLWHYAAYHLATIANSARDVDLALRWGYGWELGPFALWQAVGWQRVIAWLQEDLAAGRLLASVPLPAWVLEPGRTGVFDGDNAYSPAHKTWIGPPNLPVYQRQTRPHQVLPGGLLGKTVWENDGVRLWSQRDDVLIASFKSKMNTVGDAVMSGLVEAAERAERDFAGSRRFGKRVSRPFAPGQI